MRGLQMTSWADGALLSLCIVSCGLAGCGSNTPGRMEWVQPQTEARRVGTVYAIRGWSGVFSVGIDQMAKQINDLGITARVFMPEQYPELGATMVKRYKGVSRPEPICFIGHSRGCDSSLIIARELDKAGVRVDLIVTLDSVDEKTVPKNVHLCYNYWMPGVFGDSNLLRGIPLTAEPGFTGQIFNYNLDKEYRAWRRDFTDHISIDEDPGIQKRIVEHVLEVCPERSKWLLQMPVSSR